MTTLAQGSSATVTLADGGTISVATNGGMATVSVVPVAGQSTVTPIGPLPTRIVFGPYSEGATVTISNQTAALDYDCPIGNVVTFSKTIAGGISIYGQVVVSGLVVGAAEAAAANAALIQAAIDSTGRVSLDAVGDVYINATLRIGSDTEFVISPKTTLRLAPLSNCNLLTNKAYAATPVSVTVSWSAGQTASVAWAAHGRSMGDYIALRGANQAAYKGVFLVSAVADANNLTVTLMETPTVSPTGTITARPADVNFKVIGGRFDYDWANNETGNPGGSALHALIIGYAANFEVKGQRFSHVPKYLVCLGSVRDYTVENIHAEDGGDLVGAHNGDIVKVYGPSFNGSTGGLTGKCTDDGVSVQSQESVAYAVYDFAGGGSVLGHRVYRVNADTPTTAIAIYLPPTGAPWTMTGIEVDAQVSGAASGTLRLKISGDSTGADYASVGGQITVKNMVFSSPSSGNSLIVDRYCRVKNLTIENVTVGPEVFSAATNAIALKGKIDLVQISKGSVKNIQALVSTDATALIKMLSVSDVTAEATLAIVLLNGGTVETVNVDKSTVIGSGAAQYFVYGAAATTTKELNVRGSLIDSASANAVRLTFSAGNPIVNLIGNTIDCNCALQTSVDARLFLAGNNISNASLGVLRASGTPTVSLSSGGGNVLSAGSWLVMPSGTPVVSAYGFDIKIDVGATGVTKTNGAFCFNNGAARGTLTQNRLVTCNGTNWVQVDTPANIF